MRVTSARLQAELEAARLEHRTLTAHADDLRVLTGRLEGVVAACGPSHWSGRAAEAFRDHQQELPANARELADGYDDVAAALTSYAETVRALHADAVRAEARLRSAEGAVHDAARELTDAQQAGRSVGAVLDPGRAAEAAAAVAAAQHRHDRATREQQAAEAELEEIGAAHRRAGSRCADAVLDARERPWHAEAWDRLSGAVRTIGPPGPTEWVDVLNGLAMAPHATATLLQRELDGLGTHIRAVKQARRSGTPQERAAARKAYNAAVREARPLRGTTQRWSQVPVPGWLRGMNRTLGEVSRTADRVPGLRSVPGLSVVLTGGAVVADHEDKGMSWGHAAAKNATATAAGLATTAAVTGAVTVGATVGAPVLLGVAAGAAVGIGVGAAVEHWGDDVAGAASGAGRAAGRAASRTWEFLGG